MAIWINKRIETLRPVDFRLGRYFHQLDAVAVRVGDKRDALFSAADKFPLRLDVGLRQMFEGLFQIVQHETKVNIADRLRRRRQNILAAGK